ncbi:MAG: zinc-binding dehydrogenase, partial [Candidatus Xenobia bacterium]
MTRIPPNADRRTAALYGCALTTGFGVINHDAKVRIGESIAVFGCGGVGIAVVLGAHLAGAHPVIAIDTRAQKLEMARKFGATHTLLA